MYTYVVFVYKMMLAQKLELLCTFNQSRARNQHNDAYTYPYTYIHTQTHTHTHNVLYFETIDGVMAVIAAFDASVTASATPTSPVSTP